MPDRHKTYRLTLTPATEAALLRLKECGENKQLLSRCALWCSSDALEAIIVLRKQRYPYQVGQAGEWGECILPGPWQAIEFDDVQWRAVAVMQGAWVRDWTQQGRRTDLTAQAEPLLPPLPLRAMWVRRACLGGIALALVGTSRLRRTRSSRRCDRAWGAPACAPLPPARCGLLA